MSFGVSSFAVRVGFQTLRANPLRTVLSTLGIIMGVASLVAVLAIGDGMERFARDQISGTTDLQTVVVGPQLFDRIDGTAVPRTDYPRFTLADADSLAASLHGVATVAASVQGGTRVTLPGGSRHLARLWATTPAIRARIPVAIAAGHFFTDADVRAGARVAVLSAALADSLALRSTGGGAAAAGVVGDSILLEGQPFRVVGVLGPDAGALSLAALVPFSTASTALAPSLIPAAPNLLVRADRLELVDTVRARAERWLAGRVPDWKQTAKVEYSRGLRMEQARQFMLIFKIAMGSFAAISLLVGGIGIMNVLLASVLERTREIGIRKAIGARQRDVLVQFLSESVAISSVGALLGAMAGLAGAFGVTALMRRMSGAQVYAGFSWSSLLVAAVITTAVGLAFGTYPAVRAARLSPVDAIRHE